MPWIRFLPAIALIWARLLRRLRGWVWPAALAVAATRLALLAHYPTDVGAGLLLGVGIEKITGKLLGGRRTGPREEAVPLERDAAAGRTRDRGSLGAARPLDGH